MSGEISMAPIITGVELTLSPSEAVKIAITNTQRFAPVMVAPDRTISTVVCMFSGSAGNRSLYFRYVHQSPTLNPFFAKAIPAK